MKARIVNSHDQTAQKKAVSALKEGKIMIYPTETCYGLGCDAENKRAVDKIHRIKKEPKSKPLIILVPSLSFAKKIAKLSKTDELLVKKFMPGPLTLVVEKRKRHLKGLQWKSTAFRISSNKFALALTKKFGGALTSTSANAHRKKPLFDAKKVMKEFGGKVDLIIDAGNLPKSTPSTIYDSKRKKILRNGKIGLRQIKEALNER